MANGTQNLIGYGEAQITPQGTSPHAIVQQLFRQKQYKDEKDRYNEHQRYQQEKDLYGIVGDALNLRDFNPVIHDEVRKAKTALAKELATRKPSLGEAHMMAQNIAQGLGGVSDQFNQADKLIALSKEEYKGDKRLNLGNIEALARKDLLDQYKKTGKLDLTDNPFDRALNNNPDFALTDDSDYGVVDLKNARKQPLTGSFSAKNRKGGSETYKYNTDYFPDLYDVQRDEVGKPTLSTKTGGEFDGKPMLSDEAYGFYKLTPSNVVALNKRLKRKYPDLDLGSSEAEKLRKTEAYNDVNSKKPEVNPYVDKDANPERSASFYVSYGGQGQGGSGGKTQGNAFDDFGDEDFKNMNVRNGSWFTKDGSPYTSPEGGTFITGDKIPSSIKSALNAGGIDPKLLISGVTAKIKDGQLETISNKAIGTVTRQAMEGVYQPKTDTEPLKGQKLQFAEGGGNQRSYKLNGKSYSQAQVEAAAKKSGISVEAYIKKHGLK